MAIIVDPDLLDRQQVVFGTDPQDISIYPVAELVDLDATGSAGQTAAGTNVFADLTQSFLSHSVATGDTLIIFTGPDAGHYQILSVLNNQSMSINADYVPFQSGGALVYEIRSSSGGSTTDGVTEQAVYSFAKEEWRSDLSLFGGDDLIRHEFPFEAITREQMEIGGGTAHANWTWFQPGGTLDDFTIKKVRTGGWATVNASQIGVDQYTGVVTLGSLDSDTQVYYQQLSGTSDPTDFTFLGAVNEAIFISGSGDDRRSFLKLFARKKGRSYAQSTLSDIGVTSLETIVNRFPLAHVTDAAITNTDAEILGIEPFRTASNIVKAVDGSTTAASAFFTSATDFFVNQVTVGDTLNITDATAADYGRWTIGGVSQNVLTASADFENTAFTATTGAIAFDVDTTVILADKVTVPGVASYIATSGGGSGIVRIGSGSGNLIDPGTGAFILSGVAADDLVIISGSVANDDIYKILSVTDANTLVIDTQDRIFPAVLEDPISYKIVQPGMYLSFKETALPTLTGADFGEISFQSVGGGADIITRASGSWLAEAEGYFQSGTILTVANSVSNDGTYTVAAATDLELTLVSTDVLVTENSSSGETITGIFPFRRDVSGETFGFSWRLFGQNATLANDFQFIQHQLRQPTDIAYSADIKRGDITDLLMSFATPTATTFNMYIDDLANADINNVTLTDASGNTRTFAFVAAGTISFNANLQNDAGPAIYRMFFTNDDAGDNTGRDFGTPQAITVQDETTAEIAGTVPGASVEFTFDYDNNTQRGSTSAGTDAPVTIVAIGLETAQYVITQGTIVRSKANNFSLVSSLERVYSNP